MQSIGKGLLLLTVLRTTVVLSSADLMRGHVNLTLQDVGWRRVSLVRYPSPTPGKTLQLCHHIVRLLAC
jgi:hypothetical protein